ncbi:hypothetical protein DOTSEDRAFT_53789 [Dothistroma septosporum NZE10]|uniref:Uncharacterized protein n=1 Tax=Dothistroma septosporum (strain NZE10 / CBS 128990) TaxID=675120 RepID=N1PN09_DOTSN|nr:hypothetical protein DOTSEDRAFT_53789 [Dothistroma septosporum NZE10]
MVQNATYTGADLVTEALFAPLYTHFERLQACKSQLELQQENFEKATGALKTRAEAIVGYNGMEQRNENVNELRVEANFRQDQLSHSTGKMQKEEQQFNNVHREEEDQAGVIAAQAEDIQKKGLELKWSRYKMQGMEDVIDQQVEAMQGKEQNIQRLQWELKKKEEELENLNSQIDETRTSHGSSILMLERQQDQELRVLRSAPRAKVDELQEQQEKMSELSIEHCQSKEGFTALTRRLAEHDHEITDLRDKVQQKTSQIASLELVLAEANGRLSNDNGAQQATGNDDEPVQDLNIALNGGHSSTSTETASPPYKTISIWPTSVIDHQDGHYIYSFDLRSEHDEWEAHVRVPEDAISDRVQNVFRDHGWVRFHPESTRSYNAEMRELLVADEAVGCNVYRLKVLFKGAERQGVCRVPSGF